MAIADLLFSTSTATNVSVDSVHSNYTLVAPTEFLVCAKQMFFTVFSRASNASAADVRSNLRVRWTFQPA